MGFNPDPWGIGCLGGQSFRLRTLNELVETGLIELPVLAVERVVVNPSNDAPVARSVGFAGNRPNALRLEDADDFLLGPDAVDLVGLASLLDGIALHGREVNLAHLRGEDFASRLACNNLRAETSNLLIRCDEVFVLNPRSYNWCNVADRLDCRLSRRTFLMFF